MASFPEPVCSSEPLLFNDAAFTSKLPVDISPELLIAPVCWSCNVSRLLSTPLLFKVLLFSVAVSRELAIVPELSTSKPLVTMLTLPWLAIRLPELIRLPLLSSCKPPVSDAMILPALVTPMPFSVPIRRILPAYMAPRAETSSATPVVWLLLFAAFLEVITVSLVSSS